MDHPWGLQYDESGIVSRNNLYITNYSSVKCTPDAPTIGICIPSRGSVPTEMMMALRRMAIPVNMSAMFLYSRGLMGTSGRDMMTRQCLAAGCDYMFFMDDDVLPPPDVLYKLMRHMQMDERIGLITGVYTNKNVPPVPHIYKTEDQGAYWGFSLSPYDPPEDIWGCGAGCLLLRTEVFRCMKAPYWTEHVAVTEDSNVSILGHDLLLCHRVRESGFRTVMDGSVQCDHFDEREGRYYRIPKNSPPVVKFRNDPRNNEYWMNWWGVTPRGEGAVYFELLELLQLFNPKHMPSSLILGSGGGVVSQAVLNLLHTVDINVVALDVETQEYCTNRYMPWVVEQFSDRLLLCLEPDEFNTEMLQYMSNHTGPIIVITRTEMPELVRAYQRGAWNVYWNSDANRMFSDDLNPFSSL